MCNDKLNTVDAYIESFPKEKQAILQSIRIAIQDVAPDAEECLSYQMPTYKQNGVLASFAAYNNYVGFYPTPSGIVNFKAELTKYKSAKGSVQFPLNKPIPLKLIEKIVKFRVKENNDNSLMR